MVKLNLGCGSDIKKGFINMDHIKFNDNVFNIDLNKLPYNFDNESVDYVYMKDILEHLEEPFKVIEEIYRILNKGGQAHIEVPHFTNSSNYNDPTHKNRFGYSWFKCFEKYNKYLYYLTDKKFSNVDIQLCFSKRLIFLPLNKLFTKYNFLYEYTFLKVIPCQRIIVKLYK